MVADVSDALQSKKTFEGRKRSAELSDTIRSLKNFGALKAYLTT
jgi:hypothetical protein